MEPINGAWQVLINQGPVVAILVIALYFGAKYLKQMLDRRDAAEDLREKRYNELVDKMLSMQQGQVTVLTEALTANTAVMERVERKLQ